MQWEVIVWLILVIVFLIAEFITVGLTSIWFAAASFVAMLLAIFDVPFVIQIVVFLLVSAILMYATRPWVKKHINAKTQKTNADSLIGEKISVVEAVSNIKQTGMAVVRGQEWTLRAENPEEEIAQGEFARVVRIEGVKLIVTPIINKENEEE